MTSFTAFVIVLVALSAYVTAKHDRHPHHDRDDDPHCAAAVQYVYDGVARLAHTLDKTVRQSNKDFVNVHMFGLMHSPTARAVAELRGVLDYLNSVGASECVTITEKELAELIKRHAETVLDCEAGWKLSTDVQTRIADMRTKLQEFDNKAKEVLGECKPGENCYLVFKRSAQGVAMDKQLGELRQKDMVEMQLLSDESRVKAMEAVHRCNADSTNDLRKDVYTHMTNMKVCGIKRGLMMDMFA